MATYLISNLFTRSVKGRHSDASVRKIYEQIVEELDANPATLPEDFRTLAENEGFSVTDVVLVEKEAKPAASAKVSRVSASSTVSPAKASSAIKAFLEARETIFALKEIALDYRRLFEKACDPACALTAEELEFLQTEFDAAAKYNTAVASYDKVMAAAREILDQVNGLAAVSSTDVEGVSDLNPEADQETAADLLLEKPSEVGPTAVQVGFTTPSWASTTY